MGYQRVVLIDKLREKQPIVKLCWLFFVIKLYEGKYKFWEVKQFFRFKFLNSIIYGVF